MSVIETNSKYSADGRYFTCIWKVLFWCTFWLIIPGIVFGILWYRWNVAHVTALRQNQDERIDKLIKEYSEIKNIEQRLEKLEKDYQIGKITFNEQQIIERQLKRN